MRVCGQRVLCALCCCAPAIGCDLQGKLQTPVAGIPPWTGYIPDGQGCFTDHAQNAGVRPPYVGPRLLECGMYGCAGQWGCGGAHVGSGNSKGCPKEDCPAWPASLPKCDGSKMTPEYCSQLCLAWSESFRYAGVENGDECWCDVSLNTYGSPTDWAQSNRCVDHSAGICKDACKGDKGKLCGGFWAADVYQIRADVARAAEGGEMVLFWLLFAGGLGYVLLGSLYGARRAGKSLAVKTGAQAHDLLQAHPHYSRWAELRSLVADGWYFSRAKAGLTARQRDYTPVPQSPAVETATRRQNGHRTHDNSKEGKRSSGARKDKAASKSSVHKSKKSSKSTAQTKRLEGDEPQLEISQEKAEEERLLLEKREEGVHSSQQKIKVVGLNG